MSNYYITTPLFYVNDRPHIGSAYPIILSDVLARWHRLSGDNVFFVTGTDEHGEKIEKAAAQANLSPKQFADSIVAQFTERWKALGVSDDKFIRTTDGLHEEVVKKVIKKIYDAGDIYKGEYEGWYCTPDETFITELQLADGKCPICGRPVKKIKEETYFFRLSKYQGRLLEHYEKHPAFLSPQLRSKEVMNRVKEGLNDLSITRTSIKWGIPFPIDTKHTIYVWVEALIGYLTAVGWPAGNSKEFWPANVHVVGKEINWFHTVIWPAMLMSAGIEVPKTVFAHGWWTVEGKKMSKSLGNGIDPSVLTKKYGADALRYFMVREMPFGEDGDFSEKALISRLNGELVADLGNLVYRVLTLAERFDGQIKGEPELDKSLKLGSIRAHMEALDTFNALSEIWDLVRASNKYINDNKVWALKGKELSNALYNLLESIRIIGILIGPFMPETSEKIAVQLGLEPGAQNLRDCVFSEFKGKVNKQGFLFQKIDVK